MPGFGALVLFGDGAVVPIEFGTNGATVAETDAQRLRGRDGAPAVPRLLNAVHCGGRPEVAAVIAGTGRGRSSFDIAAVQEWT